MSDSKLSAEPVPENPLALQGMAFVEFSAVDVAPIAALFRRLGFVETQRHPSRALGIWAQGGIRFLLNSEPGTHGHAFASAHGPSISAIAFRTANATVARDKALARGAARYSGLGRPTVDVPVLEGIGGSLLYLVDGEEWNRVCAGFSVAQKPAPGESCGLVGVDHLTHNVRAGELERWVRYYKEVFGFHEIFYLEARGAATGFRTKAMRSPCRGICIPINEPTDQKSQIQEFIDRYRGEGVQHVALSTPAIYDSVELLRRRDIPFMQVLDSYYDQVDARIPGHGENLQRLRATRVLIDGSRRSEDERWKLLLQIFSEPLVGPIFLELIQRAGNEGFGDANARALFEAIEQEQVRRGALAAPLS